MPALVIDHLYKTYGSIHALNDMTFQVNPGEIYGFVGANGAGKSTTMRITLGVVQQDSGTVLIGDKPIDDSLRRTIGYMPEERGLYAKEKVISQLVFFARLHGIAKKQAEKSAMELLERLGIADRANDKLETLSLGNQQRVQLAACLIHDPEILVLDEPFSGLDPVAVDVMSELLIERTQAGVAVLFSSHQLDLVQRLCDRVGIVAKGHMVEQGSVTELRQAGPIIYEVETPTPPELWALPGTRVLKHKGNTTLLELLPADAPGVITTDQDILMSALAHGPVHSFSRKIPDLNELFKEVVGQ